MPFLWFGARILLRKDPNERKETITLGLKKKTIKAIDEAAARDGRSRSEFVQRILDRHFEPMQPTQEGRTAEIPFKMG